ncbi:TonB-dependent receptor domain-containing protein [Sphingobacterium faecium]|uniref:TonB-dependent receptor domain-containing protein n=1 Tax=Sphingobacterium faecium TaxID=34087 RepID=UPI0024694B7E|nr:TonB-dependent receptor [Sphingobacterium faecium]MDH5827983.1 TonB-dependent receptor [Sphingobacterium faecium]
MKQIIQYALIPLFLFLSNSLKAEFNFAKQDSTTTLHVAGNCGMCKKRIEKAAKLPGVSAATWNEDTQKLNLTYNNKKSTLEDIKKSIAHVGHDVENLRGDDKAYAELHECCLYPRLESSNALPTANVGNATSSAMHTVPSTDSTVTMLVAGNCPMCKKRIETAANITGVSAAVWDVDTKKLIVKYNNQSANSDAIRKSIAAAGHDVDHVPADDQAYEALHECCLYPRMENGQITAEKVKEENHQDHNHIVTGVVVEENEKGDLNPIIGVNIHWLEDKNKNTRTNENGVFKLQHYGNFKQLVVSFAGMQSDTITVKDLHGVLMINAKSNVLAEVVITGSRKSNFINRMNPARVEVITAKELFKAACCDLSESFETNASVDVVSNDAVTGSKQIQMLGLSGIYTQLTVENLPGPRGLAAPLGLNSISGTWIESIQIAKGIGSVANGYENMAGQINIELKKPQNSDRLFFNAYANNMGRTDVNLNLAQKINDNWSTSFLLHDNFMFNKSMNFSDNGFRDIPVGNLFSGINRWNYENGKGFIAQFGVKYLNDDRTGGQTDFNKKTDKGTTNKYGLGFDIERIEGFAKIGYVFPENRHRSIGLQLAGSNYNQKSYFGLKNYNGEQQNGYANLIFQDVLGTVAHKYRVGASVNYDNYDELYLDVQNFKRKETVSGAFLEYTFSPNEKFDAVVGLRQDYNSLYGWFTTPRLNLRYAPFTGNTMRLSAGRGQRTANIIAENMSALASSRTLIIKNEDNFKNAYGLQPEVSWNIGFTIDQTFRLFNREATASVELFRNNFENQVVVDYENPREISFYNLDGKSYSNSLQAELRFNPLPRLETRLAYRLLDVQTDFESGRNSKPLLAKHRGFTNLAYSLPSGWSFDYTLNIVGDKRIPSTIENPIAYQVPTKSNAYVTMNAQVSKDFGKHKNFTIYVGGENLTNHFQQNPIIGADDPFGSYFDTSLLWGPLTGRMFYTGVRFHIN